MEVALSSEMMVSYYNSAWLYNPEDLDVNLHCHLLHWLVSFVFYFFGRYHSWEMLCGHYLISVGTRIHLLLLRLFRWVYLHSVDFFIMQTMMCLVSRIFVF